MFLWHRDVVGGAGGVGGEQIEVLTEESWFMVRGRLC